MSESKMADRSPWWLALAGIFGAIVGAAITGGFSYLSHQGDVDVKMIELSVGILRSEPTPETAPLREWAIDVIDKRAKFSFNPAQRAALLHQQLPFRGSFTYFPDRWESITPDTLKRSPTDSGILRAPDTLPKNQSKSP